ncbi:MAG: hypothetical protein ABIS50_11320 [Luteolibacter sp.]|uniref:hypothetical protein n=1 Tax=Luteolibacter sp. TaxID=1962973 RepID=UPI0032647E9D
MKSTNVASKYVLTGREKELTFGSADGFASEHVHHAPNTFILMSGDSPIHRIVQIFLGWVSSLTADFDPSLRMFR